MIFNLVGPPGAGKTTLANKLGIPLLSIDEYRNLYTREDKDPKREEDRAWHYFFTDTSLFEHCIIESSGLSWRIEPFIQIRGNVYTIILLADRDLLVERIQERKKEEVQFAYTNLSLMGLIDKTLEEITDKYPSAPVVDTTGQTVNQSKEELERIIGVTPKPGVSLALNNRNHNHRLPHAGKLHQGKDMSNVTDVKLKPVSNHKTIRASGSVMIGGLVEVKITVVDGRNGLFVSLPRRQYEDPKTNETKYVNEVYIPDKGLRNELNDTVLSEYKKLTGENQDNLPTTSDGIPF